MIYWNAPPSGVAALGDFLVEREPLLESLCMWQMKWSKYHNRREWTFSGNVYKSDPILWLGA